MSATVPLPWRTYAMGAALLIPPLLEVASFERIERLLRRLARAGVPTPPDDVEAARWVDGVLSRLRGPWAHTCLRRASVLYVLLRGAGRGVDLCIGVRRDARGELLAHAWLVRDDAPYLEFGRSAEQVEQFRLIARFP